jgi:hypothetical protein
MRTLAIAFCLVTFSLAGCNHAAENASGTGDEAGTGTSVGTVGGGSEEATRDSASERSPLESAVAKLTAHEVTIPAGTELPIVLDTSVGSDTSRVEQPVRAHLSRAVVVNGEAALAEGSIVSGVVTNATRPGKVKGLGHVGLRFDTVVPRGDDERYRIDTAAIGRTAPATKKQDAVKIGAPAAGGAIVGAIVGGKKGAAIGGAAGGGAGTAVVLSTRGKEVHLPAGTTLRVRLTKPLTISVKG